MGVRCFGVAVPDQPAGRRARGPDIETLLSVKARLAAVHGNSLVL